VVSNVVTYLVDVSAPNPELQLLPGMTANVRVVTDTFEDVLKLPNAAIRFRPPQSSDDKPGKSKRGNGDKSGRGNGRPDPTSSTIYVLKNGELKAIPVKTGASDGKMVQVTGEGVTEGMEVVTGVKGEGGGGGGGSKKGSSMAGAPRMF
jgi:HlyD family secretion protein